MMTANDYVRPDGVPQIADPTIRAVLSAYLADEERRLAARTYRQYAEVIELLRHSLNGYGPNSLDPADQEIWDMHDNAPDGSEREFCDIFGPEHILPNVGEFLNYFMIRKVMAGADLRRTAGTVVKKLATWLGARAYASADQVGDSVERGSDAARDLPRAEKLATLLYEHASCKYQPKDSDIEDHFLITRVEPGKLWLDGFDADRTVGPIALPEVATKLCRVGWSISGAVRKSGNKWLLVAAWNVYP